MRDAAACTVGRDSAALVASFGFGLPCPYAVHIAETADILTAADENAAGAADLFGGLFTADPCSSVFAGGSEEQVVPE